METSPYEESGSEDTLQSKLDRATLVLQNINAYFLLVDKDFIVCDTNYYSLNKLPVPEAGVMKRVGDLLHCRNAAEAGECGTCTSSVNFVVFAQLLEELFRRKRVSEK